MEFQTIRLYGSLIVILGCFIFLYPKLLHPLILTIFGMNTKAETRNELNDIPPPLREKHPELMQGRGGGAEVPDHIKRMRQHGPHPGMRAAAAEQKQAKGSGRGMMGVILPMYAVGIIVYLVYTLFKVFGKNDKNEKDSKAEESPVRQNRYGNISSPDDPDDMDMRKLQERLAETEAQMTKILAAMQSAQTKVNTVGDEVKTASGQQEPESDNKPEGKEENKDGLNTSDRSSESSPESESYEIVNKSDRESGSEETSPQKVETLTPTEQVTREDDNNDGEKKEDTADQDEEVTDEIIGDKVKDEDVDTSVRKRVVKTEQES